MDNEVNVNEKIEHQEHQYLNLLKNIIDNGYLEEGRNDPSYNQNNPPPAKGLSTTGVVLISLGVITAIGVAVYFMRKK